MQKNKNYLLTILCMFALSSLFYIKIQARVGGSPAALNQERQREAQNQGIQPMPLENIVQGNGTNLYTQSQAQLRLANVRNVLNTKYKDKVVPFFNIIASALVKEAKLKKTHYVFYHAAPSITAVLSDLYTQLYFNEHPNEKPGNETFRFLRFAGEAKAMTPQEFLKDELTKNGLVDDSGELGAVLLSVNLAIFGNMGSLTECTWHWFVNNERAVPKPDLCQKILDKFGLSHKYIKEILALNDLLEMPEATLLQICIPRSIVDNLVYLAWIRGVPAAGPIMEWIKKYQKSKNIPKSDRGSLEHTAKTREALAAKFKKEQENNPLFRDFMKQLEAGEFSVDAFLTAYCNDPLDDPIAVNETEGRILFTKEGLHNPASGIQFYRYFTTPKEKIKEYTKKLNAIVEKLLAEKQARKK